ncbi:MAG: 1-deoxy-D-xylulose-5-phosphate reductoisomerase [Firmicutes bacterium]|nr:1-deoxy-D-xylulose-5-phosphate reductoisomerase [Bacillota bacterium]
MNISILGSTGSIGVQTVEVVQNLPNFRIIVLTAHSNYKLLAQQARKLKPQFIAMYDKTAANQLKLELSDLSKIHKFEISAGMDGLLQAASLADVQIVVNGLVGSVGLRPTLAAINAKKEVALANKETLVAGGSLVMQAAKANGVTIRPIDSEHSAIWQCLQASENSGNLVEKSAVKNIILTASGGPFRTWSTEEIAKATVDNALKHPNWNMGAKITVDSATMMNKGLERIEAQFLFDLSYDKVKILVHPQSVIHSMVEFEDGAVLAQMAAPDMKQPIQYALTAPNRPKRPHTALDFWNMSTALTFEPPNFEKFPCLEITEQAAKLTKTTLPAMMNALNELLVADFLNGKIGFYDISNYLKKAFANYKYEQVESLANIDKAEEFAKNFANEFVKG